MDRDTKKEIDMIKCSFAIDNSYGTWSIDFRTEGLTIQKCLDFNKKGIACECDADSKKVILMEE